MFLRLEQRKAEFHSGGKETVDVKNTGNKTSNPTQGNTSSLALAFVVARFVPVPSITPWFEPVEKFG